MPAVNRFPRGLPPPTASPMRVPSRPSPPSRLRALGVAALLLLAPGLGPSARAQEAGAASRGATALRRAERQLARLDRNASPGAVREARRAVEALADLAHAPAGPRGEGAEFLRRVLDRRPDHDLRIRVAAVRSLVTLARGPRWIPVLVGLAERAASKGDQDFLYHLGQALRQLRTEALAARLAAHLHDGRDFVVALALEGLAHLARPGLIEAVRPEREQVADLARSAAPRLRADAVRLLGRLGDPGALGTLLAASRDASARVRRAAAEAIGPHLAAAGAEAALGRLLEDGDPRVRETAARAFRHAESPDVLPLLAGRMAEEPLRIRAVLAETLAGLGAPGLGPDPAAWRLWLASSREPEVGGLGAPRVHAQARPEVARRYEVAYYDIPVLTDRAVFLVDTSGSMDFRDPRTGRTRFDHAVNELERVLGELPAATRFGVVTFAWNARTLPDGRLVRADPAGVRRAVDFVRAQKPSGGTNTHAALELAFRRHPEADTLYLLSDGSPTVGARTRPEAITAEVARWNEDRRVRIHTIALLVGSAPSAQLAENDDPEDAVRFMRQLALHNDGATRRIR